MSDPIVPVGGGVPVDPKTGKRYGYLPRKAASRKLVIRAQLGLAWVLGAVAAATVLGLAGTAFLLSRPDHPKGAYTDEGRLNGYPDQGVLPLRDRSGWLDRRNGLAAVAGPVAFCPADGGWVAPNGQRYDELGHTDSGRGLALWPVRAAGGKVYVDKTHTVHVAGPTEPLPPCDAPWYQTDPVPPDGL